MKKLLLFASTFLLIKTADHSDLKARFDAIQVSMEQLLNNGIFKEDYDTPSLNSDVKQITSHLENL